MTNRDELATLRRPKTWNVLLLFSHLLSYLVPMFIACIALLNQGQPADLPQFEKSLLGNWIGTLEYRDYSDNSRVKLPTMLRISRTKSDNSVTMRYVYDDGPDKIVQDKDLVSLDETALSYTIRSADGKSTDVYQVQGLKKLQSSGLGTLILSSKATENDAPVEVRETITLNSTSLDILRETKPVNGSFQFRHEYLFARVVQPKK